MITINKNVDLSFLPNIINATESIPDQFLYHQQYKLRHPKIIAYRSLDRVFKAFKESIIEHDMVMNLINRNMHFVDDNESKTDSLANSLIETLESIVSYIEDCCHIFKCTTPDQNINEIFVTKWLKKANHPTYEEFYNSIKDYRNIITSYVNEFKHNHGRIDIIVGSHREGYILGYTMKYIDQTTKNETLDLNTIKTIVPDLKYHFYQVYRISEIFIQKLKASISFYQQNDLLIQKREVIINDFEFVLDKLAINDFFVFPGSEVFSPKVYIKKDDNNLIIDFPYGVTSDTQKYVSAAKIKGMEYPKHRILLVPTEETLSKIKSLTAGMKLELSDAPENFRKIFMKHETFLVDNRDNPVEYVELDYDKLFKIKTYSDMTCGITLNGGYVSDKLAINIFRMDDLD